MERNANQTKIDYNKIVEFWQVGDCLMLRLGALLASKKTR
jgi:hypothetical protein